MTTTEIHRLHEGFRSPDPAARPMMRWWWFGPDVDRADLVRDLDDMRAAGIGGVECSFVYPMGAASDSFLSETFLADVGFAAEAAEARGLRFDVTLGSGWPYGGPHIDESTASRRLHFEREEVLMPGGRIPIPRTWPSDEFIAAYIGEGTRWETPSSYTQVERDGDHLLLPTGRGPRVLLLAISRLSGQTVKRAASGAEGWVLDHMNAAAARAHIDAVAEPLLAAAGAGRIGTVFCDSLEVFNADWTGTVPEEFEARRGYDLLPQLWRLTLPGDASAELQADFHRTLTELVEENFIKVFAEWARAKGLSFRLQCYGQPPVTISSYRHVHAIEGEGWGWDAITACRWASSAGQIYGREVISSETWTWNHSPSFRSTPLDILGEAHDHLLMGINQFIGHGWPTSPRPESPADSAAQAELGRVFYASAALDSRNAWWDAAPSLWGTLHRLSWLMRQGHRLSQVGIYLPARDISAGFGAAGRVDLYKESRLHIGDALPHAIRSSGLDFDLFDDDATAVLDPSRFPLIVLPGARDIPAETLLWLEAVQAAGGVVLDLGGAAGIGTVITEPAGVPDHLPASAEAPVRLFSGSDTEAAVSENETVAVTTRDLGPARVHFVANTGKTTAELELEFPALDPGEDRILERWDAETGAVREVQRVGASTRLELEAYEAAVLIEHRDATRLPTVAALPQGGGRRDALRRLPTSGWSVQFSDESSAREVELPHRWEDESSRSHFSGAAAYRAEITIPGGAQSVMLDLGVARPYDLADPEAAGLMEASFSAEVLPPVGAVAQVVLDGHEVGFLWKTPYRLDLSSWVTAGGTHALTLVVSNVTSHRLAADAGIPRLVAESEEAYGSRFSIQTLDLALADVESGLLCIPMLSIT
ncbi:glycosyl hydrolase [Nesterenkonia halotolerans]|uniref:glycosyl hydrolase n=1 Tax=Nesterenkonia halotolerans TaxID=225325 RepID=UPI003EE5220E